MSLYASPHNKPDFGERRSAPKPGRVPGGSAKAGRRGRSGYGTESIRPYLRAQLDEQELLRPSFPPPENENKPKAGGH